MLISVVPLKYDLQEATSATRRLHDELLCFSLLTFLPCALVYEKKKMHQLLLPINKAENIHGLVR